MTRNISALHGLRSSRAGFELTVAVQQALRLGTQLRWVNGLSQLADGLTKASPAAKKGLLEFYARGQKWSVVHDPKFVAGRRKTQLLKEIRERQEVFVQALEKFTREGKLPWFQDLEPELYRDLSPEGLRDYLPV